MKSIPLVRRNAFGGEVSGELDAKTPRRWDAAPRHAGKSDLVPRRSAGR